MSKLLWMDIETTGLDVDKDKPIEVAAVLTDADLNEIDSVLTLVAPSEESLYRLVTCAPALAMHRANGLFDAVLTLMPSRDEYTLARAEDAILSMLDEHCQAGEKVTLSGSGVATFDARIVESRMPMLHERLTYYVNDVGVLRREYKRALGRDLTSANELKPHRAMGDVHLHLQEARAFRALLTGHAA